MGRMLSGYVVRIERVTGSKEVRAGGFAAQVNVGNVRLLRGDWNKDFIEELRQFPQGKFSDQVDASADAYTEIALRGEVVHTKWRR
jgi:predicted phage terminase large subunit-like protein